MDAAELLGGLDEAQRAAVTSPAAPLAVHAGAGSGKTRVLTRRIAHRAAIGDLAPQHALAITFTRKAAGELRSRLRALGLGRDVTAGTFHAVALEQLQLHWNRPLTIANKQELVRKLLGRDQRLAPAVVAEIEWAAAQDVRPDAYADRAALAGRRPPVNGDRMADLLQRYAEEKRFQKVVDFDDLLRMAAEVMERDADAAKARRWRFRHLFVDEFQDVNPLQFRLLKGWLGDESDLFVVGDPHQAIYGWNGADAGYLDRFVDHFPTGALLRLSSNYRSTPQVVATGRAVLDTSRQASRRPDGARPAVEAHEDEAAEATAIADALQASHDDGLAWSTMAILVRTTAQAEPILEALTRRRIPHQVSRSDDLLAHPVAQRVLARLGDERYEVVVGDLFPDEGEDGRVHAVLRKLAADHEDATPNPTSASFRTWLRNAVRSGEADVAACVKVLTLHAAKGREWPIVHLAGVEEGMLPISHAKVDRAVAEEQRLLYVGITRAQDRLTLHWCGTRKGRARRPSRWLADVERALAGMDDADKPVDGRHHLPERRPKPVADPVVERLEAWRDHAARAARIPAEAVLDDLTLRAIADARPDDAEALAGVPGLGPVKAARFGEALLAAVSPSRERPSAPPSSPG